MNLMPSQKHFSIIKTENGTELVPYHDELTEIGFQREQARIKAAFPQLDKMFYLVLADRVAENKYTDEQLHDAVNHLIDNCTYPIPTIANIMSFKNRVKLYSYSEICDKVERMGKYVWSEYRPITVPGIDHKVWVSIIDCGKYKLS